MCTLYAHVCSSIINCPFYMLKSQIIIMCPPPLSSSLFIFFHSFIHLFTYFFLLGVPVPRYERGGQRTTSKGRFSPSTMWVSGSKLRSSDLETGAISLSHLANSTSFLRQGPSISQQPPGVLVRPQPQN